MAISSNVPDTEQNNSDPNAANTALVSGTHWIALSLAIMAFIIIRIICFQGYSDFRPACIFHTRGRPIEWQISHRSL